MTFKSAVVIFMLALPALLVGCAEAPNAVISPGAGYQRTPAEEARHQQEESLRKEDDGNR